ncbi:CheR family methyltransferase [Desulfosediminicola ganghwensis]|nr:CheR family methyltransferase [Desulfosediminicola ganghwensis]
MLNDTEFNLILDRYNRPWKGYRKVRKGPKKRISLHMESLDCRSVDEYLDKLAGNAAEEEELLSFLRITISRFFRDRQLWASLKDMVFPSLLQRTDTLDIWSAGCSCGEEVYSLCILHHLHFADSGSIKILATDANNTCLERGRKGIYQKSSLREVDAGIFSTYFSPSNKRNEYVIKPLFKNRIIWKQHDFFTAPPDKRFDLILLRNNLLTYHSPHIQAEALDRILRTLKPEGFLITGSHEKLPELSSNLIQTDFCSMVYQLVA